MSLLRVSIHNKIGILNRKHYVFKKVQSTIDAILELTETIELCLEQYNKDSNFLDLAKASDMVDHGCWKLLDRKHVNANVLSNFQVVKIRIQQRTILGPTLFSIYINYLL